MHPDGSGKHVFLKGGNWQDAGAAWSSDSSRMAFWSTRAGGRPEVFVANADGSSIKRLTSTPGGGFSLEPSWSPDGKRLVFARVGKAPVAGIYTIKVNGAGLTRLTHGGTNEIWPKWQP